MSKSVLALGGVVIAVSGTALYVQHADNARLRQEVSMLRAEVRQVSAVTKHRDEPKQSSPIAESQSSLASLAPRPSDGADFKALKDEIVALRKSTTTLTQLAETAQAAQALAKSSDATPTNLIPAGDLKNVGKGTPEAGTQTALWAAVGGDVDALAGSLTFTASAKTKAEAWFAGLSESTQQQYGSPEKVIALMIARDAAGLAGMQVIGQKAIGSDDVGVRVRFASVDGKTKDDTFLMHRATDGWKMVLPDAAVEKFARQVGGKK